MAVLVCAAAWAAREVGAQVRRVWGLAAVEDGLVPCLQETGGAAVRSTVTRDPGARAAKIVDDIFQVVEEAHQLIESGGMWREDWARVESIFDFVKDQGHVAAGMAYAAKLRASTRPAEVPAEPASAAPSPAQESKPRPKRQPKPVPTEPVPTGHRPQALTPVPDPKPAALHDVFELVQEGRRYRVSCECEAWDVVLNVGRGGLESLYRRAAQRHQTHRRAVAKES